MIVIDLWSYPTNPSNVITELEKWDCIQSYCKKILRESDWTLLSDSGLSMSKRLEWQAYRDALRSIPDDFINPDDVIFPIEPAEE